jgi:hypothetical protein
MARPAATTTFENWDFQNVHVQQELFGGEFISAETTLVAAGPPRLSDIQGTGNKANGAVVFPIGVLENVGLSQSKQLQRIFEIGSRRSYFIPGRVIGSITLGRVLYHGPSLLKVLYAYYRQTAGGVKLNFKSVGALLEAGGVKVPDPNAAPLDLGELQLQLHNVKATPGFNDMWLSLFSDLFNQPFGLCLYFKNALERTYGAIYLDECYLQGHQMSISSGSVLIMEGASAQFDVARPVDMTQTIG